MDSCSLPCDEPLNEDLSGTPPQEIFTISDAEEAPQFDVQCIKDNPLIDLGPGVKDVMLDLIITPTHLHVVN